MENEEGPCVSRWFSVVRFSIYKQSLLCAHNSCTNILTEESDQLRFGYMQFRRGLQISEVCEPQTL